MAVREWSKASANGYRVYRKVLRRRPGPKLVLLRQHSQMLLLLLIKPVTATTSSLSTSLKQRRMLVRLVVVAQLRDGVAILVVLPEAAAAAKQRRLGRLRLGSAAQEQAMVVELQPTTCQVWIFCGTICSFSSFARWFSSNRRC